MTQTRTILLSWLILLAYLVVFWGGAAWLVLR